MVNDYEEACILRDTILVHHLFIIIKIVEKFTPKVVFSFYQRKKCNIYNSASCFSSFHSMFTDIFLEDKCILE